MNFPGYTQSSALEQSTLILLAINKLSLFQSNVVTEVLATVLFVRFLAVVSTLAVHCNHPEVSFNWSGVRTGHLF